MKKLALLLLICCFTAGSLYAQSYPRGEVFVGYAFMRNFNFSPAGEDPYFASVSGLSLNGWNFGLSYNLNRRVGIIGEVGGNYGSLDIPVLGDSTSKINDKIRFHTMLVGPRIYARSNSRWTPFVHAMIGGTHANHELSGIISGEKVVGDSAGNFTFAVAFGGGLDYNINPRLSFRFGQLDYRYTAGDKDYDMKSNFRYCTGLLFKF